MKKIYQQPNTEMTVIAVENMILAGSGEPEAGIVEGSVDASSIESRSSGFWGDDDE